MTTYVKKTVYDAISSVGGKISEAKGETWDLVGKTPECMSKTLEEVTDELDDIWDRLAGICNSMDDGDYDAFFEPEHVTKGYVIYNGTRYESINGLVTIHDTRYRTLQCPYEGCNWECLTSESYKLAEHTKIHRPDEFHCPLCDFTSKTLEGFSEHLLKVHEYGDQAMLDTVAQQMGKRKRS